MSRGQQNVSTCRIFLDSRCDCGSGAMSDVECRYYLLVRSIKYCSSAANTNAGVRPYIKHFSGGRGAAWLYGHKSKISTSSCRCAMPPRSTGALAMPIPRRRYRRHAFGMVNTRARSRRTTISSASRLGRDYSPPLGAIHYAGSSDDTQRTAGQACHGLYASPQCR